MLQMFAGDWARRGLAWARTSARIRSTTPRLDIARSGGLHADRASSIGIIEKLRDRARKIAGIGDADQRVARGENSPAMAAKFSMCGPAMTGFEK